ncbi:MAG: hypothetical protein ACP5Q4_04980 [Candidatus Caldatribacteriaceae bacterium]
MAIFVAIKKTVKAFVHYFEKLAAVPDARGLLGASNGELENSICFSAQNEI